MFHYGDTPDGGYMENYAAGGRKPRVEGGLSHYLSALARAGMLEEAERRIVGM